jgi:hypothetical protein
MNLDET